MDRKIVAFDQDELGDWRAQLDCGHYQHVRHKPPWMNREWVATKDGRQAKLGALLSCKKCQRREPRDV